MFEVHFSAIRVVDDSKDRTGAEWWKREYLCVAFVGWQLAWMWRLSVQWFSSEISR